MKPGALILINLLITSAVVVGYDMATDDGTSSNPPAGDMYVSDTPAADLTNEGDFDAEPQLAGLGLKGVMARLEKIELENASMKALLGKAHADRINGTVVDDNGEPLPAFELPAIEEGEDAPVFDEQFLRSFQAALEKVEAQRRQQRTIDGLNRQLDRLGVTLDDAQRESVLETTMGYREKTQNLWRELPRGTDDQSREARTEAFNSLREEYSTTIYNLVPSADAEKIVSGMSRGIGFSGRGDTGGGRNFGGGRGGR